MAKGKLDARASRAPCRCGRAFYYRMHLNTKSSARRRRARYFHGICRTFLKGSCDARGRASPPPHSLLSLHEDALCARVVPSLALSAAPLFRLSFFTFFFFFTRDAPHIHTDTHARAHVPPLYSDFPFYSCR